MFIVGIILSIICIIGATLGGSMTGNDSWYLAALIGPGIMAGGYLFVSISLLIKH